MQFIFIFDMYIILIVICCKQENVTFWPLTGNVLNIAQFKITLTDQQHQLNHIARDFILQSLQVG